ncbi:MAG: hypothetical protein WC882_00265 [Candidatus Gracilibacteria bacterium]
MEKPCINCSTLFEVTDDDLKFYEQISPVFNGKKYLVPPPTHCPDCRQQRRLASCNERHLYHGECGLCHKFTLTQFPPHLKQPIYCRECWHSDQWDPCTYGQDFDFSRPFFEQVYELKRRSPAQALSIDGTTTNCEYMHYAGSSKNCYLIFHADFCEDCYYGYGFKKNTSCVDGFYNLHCELCYDCVDVHKCYGLKACQDCIGCSSSSFLRDCVGCKHCFLCVGLRNKEYYFENKPLSKEDYEKRMTHIDTGSYKTYQFCKKRLTELERTHPFKEFHGYNTENSFGDYLIHCKNTQYSFDCEDVEDGKFCYQLVLGAKNVYDLYQYGTNVQQSYECIITGGNAYHVLFSNEGTISCTDLFYCWYIENSKNCFGCVGVHHKQHCILNKQYTPEEYHRLAARIAEHMQKTPHAGQASEWGEYFPIAISLFGYNKTTAHMYYPLTRDQALAKGYKWDDYEPPQPTVAGTIPAGKIPDNIEDIPDTALKATLECEVTKKRFKITPQELKFYREQKIPLPRRSPDQRHLDRFHQRNPRQFWTRECAHCHKQIRTTFSPDRPEIVYCEGCYLKTVY